MIYFVQMTSGLFQKTRRINVSYLRRLDPKTHPVFTSYYPFNGTPLCKVNPIYEEEPLYKREYGTSSYGYDYNGRTVLMYTEWAGILRGVGSKFVDAKHRRSDTNVKLKVKKVNGKRRGFYEKIGCKGGQRLVRATFTSEQTATAAPQRFTATKNRKC